MTDTKIARFSLKENNVIAKVVQVHDGDTCDLVFEYRGELVRYSCRLEGINTAELGKKGGKGRDAKGRDAKGRDAKIARDFLAFLCTGNKAEKFDDKAPAYTKTELQERLNESTKLVHAELGGVGNFGRLLVTLKRPKNASKTFNQLLLDEEYATKYGGK